MTASFRGALAVPVVILALVVGACGDDDKSDSASDTTAGDSTETTAKAAPSDLPTCAEAYPADPAATGGADSVETRGAPEMKACATEGDQLVVIDQVTGTGAEVAAGGTVTAQYSGVVAETGEEFDSSWSRGEPATFPLDQVIQGWTDGLVGMKVGGRRTLVIPADQAYGANPPPGSGIPANADLVFTIDLVSSP